MRYRGFVLLVWISNILYAAGGSTTARQIGLGWKAGWVPAPSTETDRLAALGLWNLAANEADRNIPPNRLRMNMMKLIWKQRK
jgi:hypothetical protein